MRSLWTMCSLLAVGVFALGCGDPDLVTALDDEGPPEVLVVTVAHEGDPIIIFNAPFPEDPTFCNNQGRINVELCPEVDGSRTTDVVDDGLPIGWQVRIVFSELLDPDVEELVDRNEDGVIEGHIDNTDPVTVMCPNGEIAYDGFYDPSGNSLTLAPGPSIVIQPTGLFPAPTGGTCTVQVNSSVTDKDGLAVANAGPFDFGIAVLHFAGSDPAPASEGVDVNGPFLIGFNAPLDGATIGAGDVVLLDADNGNAEVSVNAVINAADTTSVLVTPVEPLSGNNNYILRLPATADLADTLGGTLSNDADVDVAFVTGAAPPEADAGVDAS